LSSRSPDEDGAEQISALELLDMSNAPLQEVLDQIVEEVATGLNTPIAILTVTEEAGRIWKSQSGLPSDLASGFEAIEHLLERSIQKERTRIVIEDIANDRRFANSPLLCEKGIHSCVGEPLLNRNGKVVGYLLLLDTRARGISEQEAELLQAGAKAAVEALELHANCTPVFATWDEVEPVSLEK
jgi:GAF domain-containing protein